MNDYKDNTDLPWILTNADLESEWSGVLTLHVYSPELLYCASRMYKPNMLFLMPCHNNNKLIRIQADKTYVPPHGQLINVS